MSYAAPGAFAPPSQFETTLRSLQVDRPTLVMDLDRIERRFREFEQGLGRAQIHYAVKANPAREIIQRLVQIGSNFDAASRAEIELCLSQGAAASRISFGNTIKRPVDIAFAAQAGITLFAADAEEELEKIAANAPGADVYIRVLVMNSEADWPLSRKFGCRPQKVIPLMDYARSLGLRPVGLSFHVGSQTRRADMWKSVLDEVALVWHEARDEGHALDLLNIGGGFPAFYEDPVDGPVDYGARIMGMISERFGAVPRVMAEPGRGLVAEAGAIISEVVLVSKKSDCDAHRWVYLDIGRFSGLAETEGEAIRYPLETAYDGEPAGPCILAGPSCDSADVLYEKRPVNLPFSLKSGDRVLIRNTGAYTSTYASVGFNGFPPLDVVII